MGLDTTTTAMMIEEGAKLKYLYGYVQCNQHGRKDRYGSRNEEQKQYYSGLLQKGYLSSFCLTEPDAGSDSAAVRTTLSAKVIVTLLTEQKCSLPMLL